jgi:diadenosine tetraphosphate (Ap4A) HIT family hydrolase
MNEAFCEFCQLYRQKTSKGSPIIEENDEFFALHDLDDASAVCHILLCTKEHIESALDVKEPAQLLRMQAYLEQVLSSIYQEKFSSPAARECFRIGFHLPPLISVYHIHLHGFILPFKNKLIGSYKYSYGPVFKSV